LKALLTGITGNLGYEVSLDLAQRGVDVVPCIRPGRADALKFHPAKFERIVECDLTEHSIDFDGSFDCVVHCAGVVHFRDAHNQNEKMMRAIVEYAQKTTTPVHFVSTAFVYRPDGRAEAFNNSYEQDKFNAEQILIHSGLPHSILRPSVLTGHSRTGAIRHFSGFYQIAAAFVSAAQSAKEKNQVLRFPHMPGESNMIPVDQAAASIGGAVYGNHFETLFVTNPAPPQSEWILEETLNFFNSRESVKIVDVSFQEFGDLDLTEEENALYKISQHFSPYWSMDYSFPSSVCQDNLINHDYMSAILTYFQNSRNSHGQTTD
jgi:nucleoside-diphosphate-sugar epimerase